MFNNGHLKCSILFWDIQFNLVSVKISFVSSFRFHFQSLNWFRALIHIYAQQTFQWASLELSHDNTADCWLSVGVSIINKHLLTMTLLIKLWTPLLASSLWQQTTQQPKRHWRAGESTTLVISEWESMLPEDTLYATLKLYNILQQ